MDKAYQKFNDLLQEIENRKQELQNNIDDEQAQVSELETAYRQALTKDDDKKADDVQQQMDKLKRSIERNQDKIQFIKDGANNAELENQADKVLQKVVQDINRMNSDMDKKHAEYLNLRNELFKKAVELNNLHHGHSEYTMMVERIGGMLPEWADKQDDSIIEHNGINGGYDFRLTVIKPTLEEVTERQLRFAEDHINEEE